MARLPWRGRRHRGRDPDAQADIAPLAVTKLYAPEPRAEWIGRPALIRTLADATAQRLLLISAPAGYGKSTLAAQWRRDPAETRQFAWVSLDRADNNPITLWTSIQWALRDAGVVAEPATLALSLQEPDPDIEGTFLPMLVNRLTRSGVGTVLVLDNYHSIHETACHQQLESLVTLLPPGVQLAIVTRRDPPMPLARLRAAGELLELRTERLRFNSEEVDRFVRRVSDVHLTPANLRSLTERTEGWPIAVYFAAQSLRGAADPEVFLRDFDGTDHRVRDYLAEEVLGTLSHEVRQFMIRTSILEPFSAPLCAAVAHSTQARMIIEELERANLFLVPVDEDRRWYRYHGLLRDVLQEQLDTLGSVMIKTLHRRAGAWHEQHGHVDAAIAHAMAIEDTDRAVALITAGWYTIAGTGQAATVRRYLSAVIPPRVAGDPVAALAAAWLAALAGDHPGVRHWLGQAMQSRRVGPLPDGLASVESSAALLEGTLGLGGSGSMVTAARTAVWLEADPASRWYSVARCTLGYASFAVGEPGAAVSPLRDAARGSAALPAVRVGALATLSLALAGLGRRAQAADFANAAHDLAQEEAGQLEGFFSGIEAANLAGTALGAALAGRGLLSEARRVLTEVQRVHRSRCTSIPLWPALENLLRLVEVQIGLGELGAARECADEAWHLLDGLPGDLRRYQTWLATLLRDLDVITASATPVQSLTDREIAVLRLMRSDLSLREVGAELFVSHNTVKTHARSIYRKLGASSRHEAVRRAGDLGIL